MIPSDFAKDDCKSGAEALARLLAGHARRRASYERRPVSPPPSSIAVAAIGSPPKPEVAAQVATSEEPPPPPVMPLSKIIAAVADYFHLTPMEFMSERREYPRPFARQVFMYLACELTPFSLPRIGRAIRRDHTTILHGSRRVGSLLGEEHTGAQAAVDAITVFLTTGVRDFPPPLLPPPRRWWRPNEVEALRRMRAEGMGMKHISIALNRPRSGVEWKLKRIGLLEEKGPAT